MIPYFETRFMDIGGIPVDPWAWFVSAGIVVGYSVGFARAVRCGLGAVGAVTVLGVSIVAVLVGFMGGHLASSVAYHPERLRQEGIWPLLRVWEGFSALGGILCGALAVFLLLALAARLGLRRPWEHADAIAFAFPFAWCVGRLGCFVVHDHIGSPTRFPLAVAFPADRLWLASGGTGLAGPRHDLGLYEALVAAVIATGFAIAGTRERRPGSYVAAMALSYAASRFLLDFLRNTDLLGADPRYFGLTPGHYGAVALFAVGVAVLRARPAPVSR